MPIEIYFVVFALVVLFAICAWLAHQSAEAHKPRDLRTTAEYKKLYEKSAPPSQPRIFAGRFAGRPIYASTGHRALVIGIPGAGKTTFLVNQIMRAAKDGLSFCAIDIKPELHSLTAEPLRMAGYRVIRINPAIIDELANHWNPLSEITDETQISEQCISILPVSAGKDDTFITPQREWLEAAILHLKAKNPQASLPDVYAFLNTYSQVEIVGILQKSDSKQAQDICSRIAAGLAGGSYLYQNSFADCRRNLKHFGYESVKNAFGSSDFVVSELGKGDIPTAVFFQFEEAKLEALAPLLSLCVTSLLNTLISTAGSRKPLALFLDELGIMPAIPKLGDKLNTLRSRQIPVWMYFQSTEQIERQYGRGAIDVFFGSADLKLFFALNDDKTRKLVSSLIGTTEKIVYTNSHNGRQSTRTSKKERVNVIEPHQLGDLKPGEVVCIFGGASAIGKATPYYKDFPGFDNTKK